MIRLRSIPLTLAPLIGLALLIGSCTEDEIPSTPSPPFLFTGLRIARSITPVPGTPLSVGQHTVRFEVDYTLAPEEDRQKSTFAVFADVFSRDAGGNVTVLASLQNPPALKLSGAAVPESLSFTVPAGARTVVLEAYIDTIPAAGFVVTIDTTQAWPVQ
ncbi:MAG: hypothetical protein AB1428_09880 [Bacteroidota bacterium]